jgi:type I restriction enzyme S subunit
MSELVLGNALEIIIDHRGKTPKKLGGDFTNIGVPVASALLVRDGRLHLDEARHVSTEIYRRWMRVPTRKNDVILTSEAPLGRTALVEDDRPLVLGQRLFGLRGKSGVLDSRFLYYALQTEKAQSELQARATGTTVTGIRQSELLKIRVPVRDFPIQRAIAAVLGTLDDRVIVNQKVACTVNELMKLLYERAICRGVITTSIGKVADVLDGPHATPRKTESGPWFLSISSLKDGRLALSESAHLSEDDFQRWTRRVTPSPGDVLFSYETRLGEAALMPRDVQACLGRRMALLRPRSGAVGSRTLLQAFLSTAFQDTVRRQAIHGATVNRISLTTLPFWPINLPAHGTSQLEDVLSQLDDLAANKERENERLCALRDTLLPRLMSGEIRMQETERIVEGVT